MERERKTIYENPKGRLVYNSGNYEVYSVGVVDYDGIKEIELKLMATYYPNGFVRDNLGRVGSATADKAEVFMLAKKQYEQLTGVTVE